MSVVIPAYNAGPHIREALESVLGQDVAPAEVLVIDDGSTDDTAEVVRSFGAAVAYERQAHAGPATARNSGLELTRHSIIAFHDADDVWLPGKLRKQLDGLAQTPDLDASFTHVREFVSGPSTAVPRPPQAGYLPGTMVARRSAFERHGRFPTSLAVGELISWMIAARANGLRTEMLPEVLYLRRLHADNLGVRLKDKRRDYVALAKLAIDKRRGGR